MTRVSQNQVLRQFLSQVIENQLTVNKYGQEISTGLKVQNPGDSRQAATVSQFRDTLKKIEGFRERVDTVSGYVGRQDSILAEANDLLVRANEVAAQAANETNSETERAQLAQEIFEIREAMVGLANSTYLGRYIFSGAADDQPAFSRDVDYVTPAAGGLAAYNYTYNNNTGSDLSKRVKVTEDLDVTTNTPGSQIFANAIDGLEALGRAMNGQRTNNALPADAVTNANYVFPTDFTTQTDAIRTAMDSIELARETELMPERTNVAGRLTRLNTARSLLELTETNAREVLSSLQDADVVESASLFSQAQTALDASLTVTTQMLNRSILDFI